MDINWNADSNKKPYFEPELTEYGSMAELTLQIAGFGVTDGGVEPLNYTSQFG